MRTSAIYWHANARGGGLLVVAVAAGFAGRVVGGHAAAARPAPRPPAVRLPPLPPDLAVPPAHGAHILWLFVEGRWRAVRS